jgi:carboxylesterase type B
VQTANGEVEGYTNAKNTVSIFKGIPFTAPPIGDVRWNTITFTKLPRGNPIESLVNAKHQNPKTESSYLTTCNCRAVNSSPTLNITT